VIYETDENNNIIAEYTWDNEGNPVSMTKNGQTYCYHLNGHGDVVALTDNNGNVVAEYEYDAWGNILSQTGSLASENPYRYAGYRYDEETGLYYLMARYYDANIGRFITRDTFHGFESDPLSLNQYVYSNNNPVNFTDPSGHWSKKK
jgi:RHS repeat-associated protein